MPIYFLFLLFGRFWSALILCQNQSLMLCDVFYLLSLWGLEGNKDTVLRPGKDCQKTIRSNGNRDREETREGEERIWSWKRAWVPNFKYSKLFGPFSLYFILHTVFFWLACKKRQCRCCCVCLCVLPWVAYTVYTQQKADALQHVSFCQD